MATTKVVLRVVATIAHPDGTKLRKPTIKIHVEDQLLDYDEQPDDMAIVKASVQKIDYD